LTIIGGYSGLWNLQNLYNQSWIYLSRKAYVYLPYDRQLESALVGVHGRIGQIGQLAAIHPTGRKRHRREGVVVRVVVRVVARVVVHADVHVEQDVEQGSVIRSR
jgi:hypothetical protein